VPKLLGNVVDEVGFGVVTREDDVLYAGCWCIAPIPEFPANSNANLSKVIEVRDFGIWQPGNSSLWPYDASILNAALVVQS